MPPFLFSKDNRRLSALAYGLLALLCLGIFLPGQLSIPPMDRDEPHFAQATKQMLETENYMDIRFQQEPRYKKPIGIYWLQAASVKLLNADHLDEIWAYRVPSLIGATASVLMTAALGSLLFGPSSGFAAAVLLMLGLVLSAEARLAKTDAAMLACVVTAQYALAKVYMARGSRTATAKRPGWGNAALFWGAQAAGFLIKGPLPLLATIPTILTIWRFDRRKEKKLSNLEWLKALHPVVGLIFALSLIAPWFVAINLASHGAFMQASAGHDMFAKIWQGQDRGALIPGLHALALIVVFFPSSLFVLNALPDIWANRREPRVLFCLGWIVPFWIVFELALTKLPHYVLPTYPALAILAAKIALDGYPSLKEKRWRWVPVTVAVLWVTVGLGVTATFATFYHYNENVWSMPIILAGATFLLCQIIVLASLPKHVSRALFALCLGTLVLYNAGFGFAMPDAKNIWLSQRMVTVANVYKPCDTLQLVADSYNEPSLVFLAGTHTQFFIEGAPVAQAMMGDHCLLGLVSEKHIGAFLAAFPPDGPAPEAIDHFTGFNIGKGKMTDMTLYRQGQPQEPAAQQTPAIPE